MVTMKSNSGNVLIMAILMTAVLLLLCSAYMSMVVSEYHLTTKLSHSITAINVAEAGVEEAIWELKHNDSDFDGWSGSDPVSKTGAVFSAGGDKAGEYYVEVINPGDSYPVVNAIGYIPTQAAAVSIRQIQVKVEADYVFGKAAFGVDGVSLSGNAKTDSYDSSLGDYNVGGNKSEEGDVGTNAIGSSPAAIRLYNNAEIQGDAWVGPGGDPGTDITTVNNSEITGRRRRASTLRILPSVSGDLGLPDRGSIDLDSNDEMTVSESGKYSSITLSSNSRLTIDADATLHVTGEFSLSSNSELRITNGARVTIYVDGSMSFSSNSKLNNVSQDPTAFALYGTDSLTSTVTFNSNSTFYGTFYARNAHVQFDSNAHIHGSILGKTVSLSSNAKIHYDEALKAVGVPIDYELIYWQEK